MLLSELMDEQFEEGKKQGVEEGKKQGQDEILEMQKMLYALLAEADRLSDYIRATQDKEYLMQLAEEFGLN